MPSTIEIPPAPPAGTAAPAAPAPDYSLRRYLLEGVEVLTNADSRLLRSFRALVARPGELTRAYFSAEREKYLRPLQLFLFCNILYFFVQPLTRFNTLTSPLRVHVEAVPYRAWARARVAAEVARRGVEWSAYQQRFDATVAAHAKTLVIVMVPILALVVAALLWRTRRWFVEHLVFATHFIAFFILAMPPLQVIVPLLWRGGAALGMSHELLELLLDEASLLVLCGTYFYLALRRAYALSRPRAALHALALSYSILLVMQAYRLVLFLATFYSV